MAFLTTLFTEFVDKLICFNVFYYIRFLLSDCFLCLRQFGVTSAYVK